MPFEDAIGQIIKVLLTALTMIPLPRFISIVFTSLGHLLRVTLGTTDTFRPAYFSDFGITFFILYQILDVEHLSALFIYSVRLVIPSPILILAFLKEISRNILCEIL